MSRLDIAIDAYLSHLKADYDANAAATGYLELFSRDGNGVKFQRIAAHYRGGQRAAHSFIVLAPTAGFNVGDILKDDGWKRPALNFVRGNVLAPASYRNHSWAGL